MKLIDLYIKEVGRALPEKMGADIEKELRTLVEDTLEDESERAGRPADEAMVAEVLKRMGPPEKVAASYLPPRYLIGPELFPHFVNTLRIVLAVVTVLAALAVGASLGAASPSQTPFEVISKVIFGLLDAIFRAASIVVLIFATIQLVSPNLKVETREWDPLKMKAEPDPERVNIPGALAEIILSVLALVIFNFYPQWIGLSNLVDGEWVHLPLLSQAFFRYLPLLSALWVLEGLQHVLLIAQGKWTVSQRWFSVVLGVLTAALLAWMLSGPSIVSLQVQEFGRLGWEVPVENPQAVQDSINISVRLVIGLVMALQVLEVGKQLFKLLRGRLPEVAAVS